ncbi:MAG TPA: hypothetical protein VHM65_06140 [Candidatus Lustribacter sp.]|nr:hypothetical protein [Candidatus Lustribacter sp.]
MDAVDAVDATATEGAKPVPSEQDPVVAVVGTSQTAGEAGSLGAAIANTLRLARWRRRVSQRDLAADLGVAQS